jgi:hypothetical protein
VPNPPNNDDALLATDLHVQATYRLTEALVESENRMRRRIELLSEIVFETDSAGILVFLNSACGDAEALNENWLYSHPELIPLGYSGAVHLRSSNLSCLVDACHVWLRRLSCLVEKGSSPPIEMRTRRCCGSAHRRRAGARHWLWLRRHHAGTGAARGRWRRGSWGRYLHTHGGACPAAGRSGGLYQGD